MAYAHLFEPGSIGPVKLKNRIMWASHATNYSEESGEVSDTQIEYFARRARGGVGMIVSELVLAATDVDTLKVTPLSLRADDARFVPKLARLADAVHRNGAGIGVQMSPGAGAQALGGPWAGSAEVRAASPSGVTALGVHPYAMNPRTLSRDEVRRVVERCASAAANLRRAGFDLIELHAHGGYLIHQFLSPYFNRRTDEYGGSLDNRCRLLTEIVEAVRSAIGPDMALAVKWSAEDFLPGGWDLEQSLVLVKKLEALGVDALAVSSGVHGSRYPAAPPYFYPLGTFLPFAKSVRGATTLPLYTSGRLDDPELAERVLAERTVDFVQVCRGLIADPDWVAKIHDGRVDEIRPCLACNYCRHQLVVAKPVRCSVNAAAGRERELDRPAPATGKRRVLVAGGGPAGLECARVAALRGHEVTLCEMHGVLGGAMLAAGVHNERIESFSRWLIAEVGKLPVQVRLNTEVTAELVDALRPDAVVVATGGRFVKPDIPGIDGPNVFAASDMLAVMRGGALAGKGAVLRALSKVGGVAATPAVVRRLLGMGYPVRKEVAVIGGQFAGCSLALLLARKGKQVTLIEESERYGKDLESNTLVGLADEVAAGRVTTLVSSRAVEITRRGVVVQRDDGEKTLVAAGTVMVAIDPVPDPGRWVEALAGKAEVRVIGDAKSFERIPGAVSGACLAACEL